MARSAKIFSMSVPFSLWVGVVRDTHSSGAGTGALSQGGAVAARLVHTPEVAGSTPALATLTTPAGRGLPDVCCFLLRWSAPALCWPGIFFVFVHGVNSIFLPGICLSKGLPDKWKGL